MPRYLKGDDATLTLYPMVVLVTCKDFNIIKKALLPPRIFTIFEHTTSHPQHPDVFPYLHPFSAYEWLFRSWE